jgi:hypothetical protein
MNSKLLPCLALVLSGILFAWPSVSAEPATNNDLTKQISAILTECQKIKPGMTRAELSKIFSTEGGLSNAKYRTYDYRGCPYIKVDVVFILSQTNQDEEKSTDTIAKISKPYLDWIVID